jgi:hypothetical protein
MRQKTHRSRNKFTLRCDYRRTVDEINFDCGAFFTRFSMPKKRVCKDFLQNILLIQEKFSIFAKIMRQRARVNIF